MSPTPVSPDLVSMPIVGLIITVCMFLIGLLILWFVIYTAVRSALRSHRDAMAEERGGTR